MLKTFIVDQDKLFLENNLFYLKIKNEKISFSKEEINFQDDDTVTIGIDSEESRFKTIIKLMSEGYSFEINEGEK